jgi:VanZ family protein
MRFLFPIIWLGLIVIASLTPADKIPDFQLFLHADKVIHFFMYCGFSFLLIPALTLKRNFKMSYLFSFLFSVTFGIIMEYFQNLFILGRTAEFFDFVANIIGSITGIAIYHLAFRDKKYERKLFKI